ncbi:MAG: hypothetical protein WC661_06180 [Opitutaceae bacterium]|jgi:hypothetical protein
MITRSPVFRSPAILSVRVCPTFPKLVFVITSRPSLVGAVGDLLREDDRKLSVVWLPSVALARNRLKWDRAAMVILDDIGEATDDVVNTLQTASPGTQVLVFQHDVIARR